MTETQETQEKSLLDQWLETHQPLPKPVVRQGPTKITWLSRDTIRRLNRCRESANG